MTTGQRRVAWGTVIIAVIVFVAIVGAAHAQTVDIRPTTYAVLDWAASAAATVLTVLGGFAIRWVAVRTGLENSKLERDMNERLDFIIRNAIDFAHITAQNEVAKRGAGLGAVKVDNFFVKLAADAVQMAAPGILSQFKLDRAAVERLVISRIPSSMPMTVAPAVNPVAGGMATPQLAKEAIREVGRPGTVEAAQTPKPQPGPELWNPAAETVG